jgi:hypothetical protein
MRLAELRKLAVRQRLEIRFTLSQGLECLLDSHGVVRIPALRATPAFNVEQELALAPWFRLRSVSAAEPHGGERLVT